jgi:hypothetical protein
LAVDLAPKKNQPRLRYEKQMPCGLDRRVKWQSELTAGKQDLAKATRTTGAAIRGAYNRWRAQTKAE